MPESLGYNNILVVVDQFSKEAVFIPYTKEETPSQQLSCFETTSGVNMAFLLWLFLIVDRSSCPIL